MADVISDFEDGTLQGWVPWGDTLCIGNPGTGGNPGGYVHMDDCVVNTPCWMVAPAQYLGNWHNKSIISVDLISITGDSWWSNVKIEISGPGGDYTRDLGEKPPHYWKTYQTTLDESLWTRKSGSWSALLDNVTDFRILLEYVKGDESNGMDNVRLIDKVLQTSIGLAKQEPDGRQLQLTGIVTRITADRAYIQAGDRSAGICIDPSPLFVEGNIITVTGTIATVSGERKLQNVALVSSVPGVQPKPLYIISRELGGKGKTLLDPTLGNPSSLKETGLLIRTVGTITQTNTDGTFTMKDGSGLLTGKCAADVATPIPNSVASLTGISSTMGDVSPIPALLLAHNDCTFFTLPLGSNLIRNGGAEEGPSGTIGEEVRPIPGWTATAGFTSTRYGYIYPDAESQLIGGGRNFFFCGLNIGQSEATQTIDVSCLSNLIDAKKISVKLSGNMGGRGTEGDYGTVTATFYDATGTVALGTCIIGPQAASNGHLKPWTKSAAVPTGTRKMQVKIKGIRTNGNNCDAFFDNLSLVLTSS